MIGSYSTGIQNTQEYSYGDCNHSFTKEKIEFFMKTIIALSQIRKTAPF